MRQTCWKFDSFDFGYKEPGFAHYFDAPTAATMKWKETEGSTVMKIYSAEISKIKLQNKKHFDTILTQIVFVINNHRVAGYLVWNGGQWCDCKLSQSRPSSKWGHGDIWVENRGSVKWFAPNQALYFRPKALNLKITCATHTTSRHAKKFYFFLSLAQNWHLGCWCRAP